MVKHGLNADREAIFVDQRGTHRADPSSMSRMGAVLAHDSAQRSRNRPQPWTARHPGVPRPAGRDGRRPRRVQRTENAADIADSGWRWASTPGTSTESPTDRGWPDRPARSPTRNPQRDSRLGVARHEQHRREVVVGSGQLVQGDLRCVCCPAGVRRSLPEPGRNSRPR